MTGPADAAVLDAAAREALAALVAVTARRTYGDVVVVTCDGVAAGVAAGVAEIDVSTDPSFADLCVTVGHALGIVLSDMRSATVAGARLVVTGGTVRLYPDAGAPEVAGQVRRALCGAERAPLAPISVLDLACERDREDVARFGRGAEPAAPRSVVQLVRACAAAHPDAPAVTGDGRTLSYRELVRAADGLARACAGAGVRRDEVVGVLGERSPELVVALLAVLGAGAAYLALQPDWPDARISTLLDDGDVRVVLADPGLAARVPPDRTVVPFDAAEPAPPVAPPVAPAVALPGDVPPDASAYVSYTSGSTGEPKGVCVPHRAVSRLVDGPDWVSLGPGDTVLQAAPVAFDASTFELWAPLAAGARLLLLPRGGVDPAVLASTVADEGVTVLWLTAGLFHQMVDRHVDRLTGVRHLLAGGDVVSPDAVRRVLDACPGLVVTNGYGPTENTTFTTCATFGPGAAAVPVDGPLPVGHPVRGTDVQVLDRLGRPVPPGVVGHVYALGAGLARGYLGRPAATAEAFLPAAGGARRYRTGDLGRWRADGMLEFVGRVDEQVKVTGYRVEPDEVAAVLRGHPGVGSVEVVAVSGAGGTRLVACVVPTGAPPRPRELRDWARSRVPEFLVPSDVVLVEAFPLTGNGKLDRAALARSAVEDRADPAAVVAADTPLERYLCRVWAEMLTVDEVGVDDDFFGIGGQSLIAGDLLARLQDELGVEIPASILYLGPTVAELAESDELRPMRDRADLDDLAPR